MPEVRPGSEPPRGPFDREIGVRGLVFFGIGLALVIGVASVAMWAMFHGFESRLRAKDTAPSPLLAETGTPQPPEPRLQTTPVQDLAAVRAMEDSLLHGYGWVDRSAGVARIPIESAMDLLLARGVPVRAEPRPWVPPGTWRDPSLEHLTSAAAAPTQLDSIVR